MSTPPTSNPEPDPPTELFEAVDVTPPPPRRRSGKFWLTVTVTAMLALVLLCGGLFTVQRSRLNKSVQAELAGNVVLSERIGSLESASLNLTKSGERAAAGDDSKELAFDVVGTTGAGTVYVQLDPRDQDDFTIRSAVLRTEDGQTYSLNPPTAGSVEVSPVDQD